MKRFEGHVAAVTGAASGIGEAIVRRLLSEGAKVIALDLNGSVLTDREREHWSVFHGVAGDVTDERTVERLITDGVKRFGRLDMAFNVAGGGKPPSEILNLSVEDWDFTIDLCLKGVFLCVKHEARHMRSSGGGCIVNVGSINSHVPAHALAAYCSAKAGVEMLTKVAALEFAQHRIRVNALLPGFTYSPPMKAIKNIPDLESAILERIPMQRGATPDEIAEPALFLASADASYTTGASLLVDGAWKLTGYPDMRRWLKK